MSQVVPVIAFPENVRYRHHRPKTLIYLIKLFYGSGVTLIGIYALAILVISPLLELQFERRLEILQSVGTRLRESIYTKITRRLKEVPNVLVKYGDKLYSDASTATDEKKEEHAPPRRESIHKSVRFEDEVGEQQAPVDLNEKLVKLKETLLKLHITDYAQEKPDHDYYNSSEMQPLMFQIGQLQSYLDLINERIFRRNVKGFEFFQRGARSGKAGANNNIVLSLMKDIKQLRKHALKNY